MTQDIRTLLLAKIKPGSAHIYNELFGNNCLTDKDGNDKSVNNFVTIGNYDAVMAFKTSDYIDVLNNSENENPNLENILQLFEDEKRILAKKYEKGLNVSRDTSAFFHPIHIIRYDDMNGSQTFWEQENTCFAVVFIYGNTLNAKKEKEQKPYLLSDLENDIKSVINLPKENYLIYRSVNLSELVLVCKYHSLKEILENVAAISYTYPMLQTHTVCGFRYDLEENCICSTNVQDEEIPMVKVTGTIRSHEEAFGLFDNEMYPNIPGEKYIAFGNNDFNLIYPNIKTKDIISTLNTFINNPEKVKNALASKKTRVHLLCDRDNAIRCAYESDINFQDLIVRVQTLTLECQKVQPNHTEWVYTFVETLNMLSDMCNSQELARIRYFASDTLFCFENTVNNILNDKDLDKEEFFKSREELLNEFTEGFTTLIERIVRVDGYLSQEPGYSPLIYNMIPAGILEYYCSYFKEVIGTVSRLTKKEDDKYTYSILPLPALVNHIAFEDIFPNEKPDQRTQVNLLSIPYNQLYHPKNLLFSSTHEIMHFCGEDMRCREYRYKCFINFLASYFVYEFKLSNIYTTAIPYITHYLTENIDDEGLYFKTLSDKIGSNIYGVYQNVELKKQLQYLLTEYYSKQNEKVSTYDLIFEMNDVSYQMNLLALVTDIIYLFKECYADLMTVNLLQISGNEYCELLEGMDRSTKIRDKNENVIVDSTLNLREALVVYTAGYTAENVRENEIISRLVSILQDIDTEVDCQTKCQELAAYISGIEYSFESLFYDKHCIKSLIDYLKQCNQVFMQLKKKDAESVEKISKYYEIGISPEKLFSDEYCELVYHVREKLKEDLVNAKSNV